MTVRTLASGYSLIEGPRVAPDGSLYFSDVRNGGVHRLFPDGRVELAIPKRRGVGGIALHADGGIVVSGRNICHVRDGVTRILYERDDVGGFNDLFADGRGRVYVGSLRDDPFTVTENRRTGDCYRIDAPPGSTAQQAVTLYEDIGLTNGIGFSPEGTKIYHADSAIAGVIVHEIDTDGNVDRASRSVLAPFERGFPDGLAVDRDGGVWVAVYGAGCVARVTPDGAIDRRIDVPAVAVTSLCFAGAALDELIVVTADNTDDPARGGTVFHISADDVGAVGLPPPLVTI